MTSKPTTPIPQDPAPILVPRRLKIATPDNYHGDRDKLKAFLSQAELYAGFFPEQFNGDTDKVLWAVSFLRGQAFSWIESFMEDFMKNKNKDGKVTTNMGKGTQEVFLTWAGFKTSINRVFGDIDAGRTAERIIQNLRQRGSATTYTAEFQQYSNKTDWNDDALKAQYYRGLKDIVKDEIARSDRPRDLQAMVEQAIKIDNRNYERQMEKRGHYAAGDHKRKGNNQKSYWPQPMELDATFSKKKPSKEEMDRRRDKKLCFECGLPGHMASSHRKGNKKPWKGKGRQLNATNRGGPRQLNATARGPTIEVKEVTRTKQLNATRWQRLANEQIESIINLQEEGTPPTYNEAIQNEGPEGRMLRESLEKEPQMGEIWKVISKGEERVWMNMISGFVHTEKDVFRERPAVEKSYKVIYKDIQRIG